jgi:hypothetical protein
MKKPIAVLATVVALAAGGVAVASAASGGGVFGSPEEQRAEFATDLASRLDGVTAEEIETGLSEIGAERKEEMLQRRAGQLAAGLDGVTVEQARTALESLEPDSGSATRPDPRQMEKELAAALGVTVTELRQAHRQAHRSEMNAQLERAVDEGVMTSKQAARIRRQSRNPRAGHGRGGPPGGPGQVGGFGGPGGPPPGIGMPGGKGGALPPTGTDFR